MEKGEIRREFFKLRNNGFSYAQCRRILKSRFSFDSTTRTLKRWSQRLDKGEWDLLDASRRPHTLHFKITPRIEEEVLSLRERTGWGSDKIVAHSPHLGISPRSVDKILFCNQLCRPSKNKGKQRKWVRWQRHHPDSLWQIDHTDEQDKLNCYTLSVLDDCSRYSLCLVKLNRVTTDNVTHILEGLIRKHGAPREILTDNGGAYGLNSTHSRFDRWCKRHGIRHIRTKIHSPTTNGKVERLFRTMDEEMAFCNGDLEQFRMRYNHFRPHSSLNNRPPAEIYFAFWKLF